jgi:hypothetical protein
MILINPGLIQIYNFIPILSKLPDFSEVITSYHNIKTEETVVPNFNQRKAVLHDYLSKHNIPFQPLETKKQFYEKIKGIFGASAPSTGNHM